MTRFGSHVPATDPLGEAAARAADCAQLFLSSPRSWTPPKPRADAGSLRSAKLPLFVHAPYLINLASPADEVRARSAALLQSTLDAAMSCGAAGVVVHAGQAGSGATFTQGLSRWLEAAGPVRSPIPVLVENLAGGSAPMARTAEEIATLVLAARQELDLSVGVCLDTCHTWAAGEASSEQQARRFVSQVVDQVGAVDLVHVNGSKDPSGSRRDRHDNLHSGLLPRPVLLALVEEAHAGCALVETPGERPGQRADVEFLRSFFGAS